MTIMVGESFKPPPIPFDKIAVIDEAWLTEYDWPGVDITKEENDPESSVKSVHQGTEEWIKKQSPNPDILIKDHAKGEIADYIAIFNNKESKEIHFYHCKASKLIKPGASVSILYELVGQAMRTTSWVHINQLFSDLKERLGPKRRPNTKCISWANDIDLLEELSGDPTKHLEFKYIVYLVQPGLRLSTINHTPRINALLANCYSCLSDGDLEMRILASPDI